MATARLRVCALLVLALLVAGCSANHHSVFRNRAIAPKPAITTVDAKQRAIISVPRNDKVLGVRTWSRRFCAEPSPDVFSVLAQAFSSGGSFGQSGDPKALDVAASIAYGSAEQSSTIPRTQTVNMLREMMFRTCERYLNGGIGELELPIQAVRDQRLMVSILAIEQLTGAVTARPAIVGASAKGGVGGMSGTAVSAIDDAWKAYRAAEVALVARRTEFDKLEGAAPSCTSIDAKVAKQEALTGDEPTKQKLCNDAKSALNSAADQFSALKAHYDTLVEAVGKAGIPASVQTELNQIDGGEGGKMSQATSEIAKTVQSIVDRNFNDSTEIMLFCIRYIQQSGKASAHLSNIGEECQKFLFAKILVASSDANLEREKLLNEFNYTTQLYESTLNSDFEKFWSSVSSGSSEKEISDALLSRVQQLKNHFSKSGLPPQTVSNLDRLARATDRQSAWTAYASLEPFIRQALSGGN